MRVFQKLSSAPVLPLHSQSCQFRPNTSPVRSPCPVRHHPNLAHHTSHLDSFSHKLIRIIHTGFLIIHSLLHNFSKDYSSHKPVLSTLGLKFFSAIRGIQETLIIIEAILFRSII